jgi:septal ring factor EnvC (AmiA/AmiB activator)
MKPVGDADANKSGTEAQTVRERGRLLNIGWDVFKFATPAALALVIMWVRVQDHEQAITKLQVLTEARADKIARIQEHDKELARIQEDEARRGERLAKTEGQLREHDAAQRADFREMTMGLKRLEEILREVRTDVKELQGRK